MNFFGVGPAEIILILVVALIVFGPGKLPEIGSTLGKSIREFKRATSEMTEELTQSMNEVRKPIEEVRRLPLDVEPEAPPRAVASLEAGRVCPICATSNPSENKFCGSCGAQLKPDDAHGPNEDAL